MVLDVGSRLGAVLYMGYYHSNAERLVGVEMNEFFCSLQKKTIERFDLGNRISVVCADVCTQAEWLKEADVIVMHNVFDFFLAKDVVKRIWELLMTVVTNPGCRLVCSPSLETCFESVGLGMEALNAWVKEILWIIRKKMTRAKIRMLRWVMMLMHIYTCTKWPNLLCAFPSKTSLLAF